jgi:biotin transport system permease protein
MTSIGLYHPGNSWLHRCPAGVKVLALLVSLPFTLWYPLPALAAAVLLYGFARIPWRLAVAQVRPLVLILVLTAGFQAITMGPYRAVTVTVGLFVSVALAGLVTLTTRVSAMLDVIAAAVRPLRRFGVDPDRFALLLALTIRSVPLLVTIVDTVRQAPRARGAPRNPLAFAVPGVVRALRAADALGEALTARGFDD